MSEPGLLREVLDDLRDELRLRRVQVLAAVAYIVLAAGGLYLFSSIGEDSRAFWDVHRRTTLAAIGTGLLGLAVLLSITTLVLERAERLRPTPGRQPGVLPSRRGLVAATVVGIVLAALGVLALSRWE
jgi:ABC-type uncharacterized transport system permease subunit